MTKEEIMDLVQLIDKNAQSFPDFDYMQAMTICQRIYNQPMVGEIKFMSYGPAFDNLSQENDRLKSNNQRLKRSHKNKRKQWRETEDQLRTQINELLNEVEYLEQFKNRDNKKIILDDYIKK